MDVGKSMARFKNFLTQVNEILDDDPEVLRLIEKRHKKANPQYIHSPEFAALMAITIKTMQDDMSNKYVILKEVITELKAYDNKKPSKTFIAGRSQKQIEALFRNIDKGKEKNVPKAQQANKECAESNNDKDSSRKVNEEGSSKNTKSKQCPENSDQVQGQKGSGPTKDVSCDKSSDKCKEGVDKHRTSNKKLQEKSDKSKTDQKGNKNEQKDGGSNECGKERSSGLKEEPHDENIKNVSCDEGQKGDSDSKNASGNLKCTDTNSESNLLEKEIIESDSDITSVENGTSVEETKEDMRGGDSKCDDSDLDKQESIQSSGLECETAEETTTACEEGLTGSSSGVVKPKQSRDPSPDGSCFDTASTASSIDQKELLDLHSVVKDVIAVDELDSKSPSTISSSTEPASHKEDAHEPTASPNLNCDRNDESGSKSWQEEGDTSQGMETAGEDLFAQPTGAKRCRDSDSDAGPSAKKPCYDECTDVSLDTDEGNQVKSKIQKNSGTPSSDSDLNQTEHNKEKRKSLSLGKRGSSIVYTESHIDEKKSAVLSESCRDGKQGQADDKSHKDNKKTKVLDESDNEEKKKMKESSLESTSSDARLSASESMDVDDSSVEKKERRKKEGSVEKKHRKKKEESREEEDDTREDSEEGSSCVSEQESAAEKKRRRQISRLEGLLKKISDEIQKLQERELDLDELGEEDSTYTLEDRYKKRFMKVWDKLCELQDCNKATGRLVEKKFRFEGTRYPEINKKVERFINYHQVFPDFHDIRQVVYHCNVKYKLRFNKKKVNNLARDIFTDVGNSLQRRRLEDYSTNFGSHLTDKIKTYEDPALYDKELRRKLEANKQTGKTRLDAVLSKYSNKQDNDDEDETSSGEEEEEEEDEIAINFEDVNDEETDTMETDLPTSTETVLEDGDVTAESSESKLGEPEQPHEIPDEMPVTIEDDDEIEEDEDDGEASDDSELMEVDELGGDPDEDDGMAEIISNVIARRPESPSIYLTPQELLFESVAITAVPSIDADKVTEMESKPEDHIIAVKATRIVDMPEEEAKSPVTVAAVEPVSPEMVSATEIIDDAGAAVDVQTVSPDLELCSEDSKESADLKVIAECTKTKDDTPVTECTKTKDDDTPVTECTKTKGDDTAVTECTKTKDNDTPVHNFASVAVQNFTSSKKDALLQKVVSKAIQRLQCETKEKEAGTSRSSPGLLAEEEVVPEKPDVSSGEDKAVVLTGAESSSGCVVDRIVIEESQSPKEMNVEEQADEVEATCADKLSESNVDTTPSILPVTAAASKLAKPDAGAVEETSTANSIPLVYIDCDDTTAVTSVDDLDKSASEKISAGAVNNESSNKSPAAKLVSDSVQQTVSKPLAESTPCRPSRHAADGQSSPPLPLLISNVTSLSPISKPPELGKPPVSRETSAVAASLQGALGVSSPHKGKILGSATVVSAASAVVGTGASNTAGQKTNVTGAKVVSWPKGLDSIEASQAMMQFIAKQGPSKPIRTRPSSSNRTNQNYLQQTSAMVNQVLPQGRLGANFMQGFPRMPPVPNVDRSRYLALATAKNMAVKQNKSPGKPMSNSQMMSNKLRNMARFVQQYPRKGQFSPGNARGGVPPALAAGMISSNRRMSLTGNPVRNRRASQRGSPQVTRIVPQSGKAVAQESETAVVVGKVGGVATTMSSKPSKVNKSRSNPSRPVPVLKTRTVKAATDVIEIDDDDTSPAVVPRKGNSAPQNTALIDTAQALANFAACAARQVNKPRTQNRFLRNIASKAIQNVCGSTNATPARALTAVPTTPPRATPTVTSTPLQTKSVLGSPDLNLTISSYESLSTGMVIERRYKGPSESSPKKTEKNRSSTNVKNKPQNDKKTADCIVLSDSD